MTEDEISAFRSKVGQYVLAVMDAGLGEEADFLFYLSEELIAARIRANNYEKALHALEGK